jgi:hypothetical protein
MIVEERGPKWLAFADATAAESPGYQRLVEGSVSLVENNPR